FLRASGGKGLHVVVPLNPGCDWDLTKRFARGFAETLAQSQPDRFLATATKSKRSKRIFIDYLRNGRGAGGCVLFAARPARRAGGDAAGLARAVEAAGGERGHHQGRAGTAQAPAQGSLGRDRRCPAEPGALGAGRLIRLTEDNTCTGIFPPPPWRSH